MTQEVIKRLYTLAKDVEVVPYESVKLIWHSGYWDGPLSGMLEFRGEQCWFQLIDETISKDEEDWYSRRKFAIIRLTPSQLEEEWKWHNLFREKVGTHTDYDEFGERDAGVVKPRETWHEFYEPRKKRDLLDLSQNEVIASFER